MLIGIVGCSVLSITASRCGLKKKKSMISKYYDPKHVNQKGIVSARAMLCFYYKWEIKMSFQAILVQYVLAGVGN